MTAVVQTGHYRVLTAVSNTIDWLQLRQCGVGASESAALLGESAWGTPRRIYDQKIAESVTDETTDLMEFGHLAEPLIVAFMEAHPERYGWIGEIHPGEGLLQSIAWPWLLGTLDRRVRTPLGVWVPLELKSVNDHVAAEWRVDEGDEDGREARYEVPIKYQVQVQQQMAVTGAPFAYVAAWLGKDTLALIRVDRDDAFIEEYLVGVVGDFWKFNVEARNPPPLTINDDLWKHLPGDPTLEPIDGDEDLVDVIGQWRIATTDYRELRKEIKQLQFLITDRMGNATAVNDPLTGKTIHTLKGQRTARGTDFDLLAAKYPDAYDECIRPAGWTRVHRATKESV